MFLTLAVPGALLAQRARRSSILEDVRAREAQELSRGLRAAGTCALEGAAIA